MKNLFLLLAFCLAASSLQAAFSERYVTVAGAGAHDGTSEANAWTFGEMITAAPSAGTRINIKAGSYSEGARTLLAGTAAAHTVYRGYNSTIGDLETQGWNSDGTLNTTGFPEFTLTGSWVPATYTVVQNLVFTSSSNIGIISSSTVDGWAMVSCKMSSSGNSASARCLQMDDSCKVINSEFSCTGGTHASVVLMGNASDVVGSRFNGNTTGIVLLAIDGGAVSSSVFTGGSGSIGISIIIAAGGMSCVNNTFWNIGTGVTLPNLAVTRIPEFINNHVTGCAKWIDSLYSATANLTVIEFGTRIRDVATPRTGIESISIGEISTAGTDSDDFVAAGSGDFQLKATAAGTSTGLRAHTSVGAFQRAQTGGGSGTQKASAYP